MLSLESALQAIKLLATWAKDPQIAMDHLKVLQSRPCMSIWILEKYGTILLKSTDNTTTYAFLSFNGLPILLLLLQLSHFSHVRLCVTPETAATRLPHPWDSPGKNTSGCHFLLQCMKVKSESEVTQSCPTLSDPMDCSLPGSSIHRIFQAKYWSGVALPSV